MIFKKTSMFVFATLLMAATSSVQAMDQEQDFSKALIAKQQELYDRTKQQLQNLVKSSADSLKMISMVSQTDGLNVKKGFKSQYNQLCDQYLEAARQNLTTLKNEQDRKMAEDLKETEWNIQFDKDEKEKMLQNNDLQELDALQADLDEHEAKRATLLAQQKINEDALKRVIADTTTNYKNLFEDVLKPLSQ